MDNLNLYLFAIQDVAPAFLPVFLGVFGAIFGSFITCALYRVPRGISLRNPPSSCPSCKHRLGVLDLVPVLSYLLSGGKCRHCKVRISPRYVFLELLCILSGVLSWYVLGPHYRMFILFVLLLCTVYMLWGFFESKHKPYKVLLFSIILLFVLAI